MEMNGCKPGNSFLFVFLKTPFTYSNSSCNLYSNANGQQLDSGRRNIYILITCVMGHKGYYQHYLICLDNLLAGHSGFCFVFVQLVKIC